MDLLIFTSNKASAGRERERLQLLTKLTFVSTASEKRKNGKRLPRKSCGLHTGCPKSHDISEAYLKAATGVTSKVTYVDVPESRHLIVGLFQFLHCLPESGRLCFEAHHVLELNDLSMMEGEENNVFRGYLHYARGSQAFLVHGITKCAQKYSRCRK